MRTFSSAGYWEERYQAGANSGAGSYGRLGQFKIETIKALVADHGIASVIDLGCGDGNLALRLNLPGYVGVDVSPAAVARCRGLCPQHRFILAEELHAIPPAELSLSIDVIYHLVEDDVFAAYITALFGYATRFVLIYASNADVPWPAPHVRHRRFSDHVAATQPGWRLLAHVPNPYPYDPAWPKETSFADFFLFGRVS